MPLNLVVLNHCPVCKKPADSRPLYELDKFSVFQCSCGMRFIDPSLDAPSQMEIYQNSETLQAINPALEQYYEYETLAPNSQTRKDYTRALEEAAKLAKGKKLLEVGCGGGTFLQFAKTMGWDVWGIDSSSDNIESIRKKGLSGICSGFLECQVDEKFDVIVLWDLIEHPQDPGLFLEKCRELLNEGGLILLATPQDPNILSVLAELFYKISGGKIKFPVKQLYIIEHTTYFGSKSLSGFVENFGFKVEKFWKTETDLARYRFSPIMRLALNVLFFVARFTGLQNRLLLIARKVQ